MDLCHRPLPWQGAVGMWRKESCPTQKKHSMSLLSSESRNKERAPVCPRQPEDMTYIVQVLPQCNLAGDQLVGEVVVLLLQSHVGLLQAPVLALWAQRGCQDRGCQGVPHTAPWAHTQTPTLHLQSAKTTLPAWNSPGQRYSHSANVK